MTVWIELGDGNHRTPFEAQANLPSSAVNGWAEVTIPLREFTRAAGGKPRGVRAVDPLQVVPLCYDVKLPGGAAQATVWTGDVAVLSD